MAKHAHPREQEPLTVHVDRSEMDDALLVIIDTEADAGEVRVLLNDAAIWDADPEVHHHEECSCVNPNAWYRLEDFDGTPDEADWLQVGHMLDLAEVEWLRALRIRRGTV